MVNDSVSEHLQKPLHADRAGEVAANAVSEAFRLVTRRWRLILAYQVFCFTALVFILSITGGTEQPDVLKRSWGGFNKHPIDEKCYKQERVAMLLALFLGTFGIDQFYAQHWVLAVFKLLTLGGLGWWSLVDIILWIVGGVYGTPGCPGGSSREWAY